MQAEIEAAKAAFLDNGGKITILEGFTGIAPLKSLPTPGQVERLRSPDDLVGRGYVASEIGMQIRKAFDRRQPWASMLPEPVATVRGRLQYRRGDVAEAAARIRESLQAKPAPTDLVTRKWICDALGVTLAAVFRESGIWHRFAPEPVPHTGGRHKFMYKKDDALKFIARIKRIRAEREARKNADT